MKTPPLPILAAGLSAALLLAAPAARAAMACDALRSEIEAKIIAGGVTRFNLTVVDASAPTAGRVVGTCELGSRKVVYEPLASGATPAAGAASPARSDRILTECKDGSVSMGGSCKP